MLTKSFRTDAAATTGTGIEINSLQTQVIFSHGIRILALKQAPGAVLANDADWELWTDYRQTGMRWVAEELSPVNDGGVKLGQKDKRVFPISHCFPFLNDWYHHQAKYTNTVELARTGCGSSEYTEHVLRAHLGGSI